MHMTDYLAVSAELLTHGACASEGYSSWICLCVCVCVCMCVCVCVCLSVCLSGQDKLLRLLTPAGYSANRLYT